VVNIVEIDEHEAKELLDILEADIEKKTALFNQIVIKF